MRKPSVTFNAIRSCWYNSAPIVPEEGESGPSVDGANSETVVWYVPFVLSSGPIQRLLNKNDGRQIEGREG